MGRVLARANLDAQAMQRRCAIGYYALWDMGARPLDPQEDPPPEHRDNAIGDPAHDSGDLQTDESDMECDDLGSLAGSLPPFGDEEVAQHPDMAEAASMEDEEDVFGHGLGSTRAATSAGAEQKHGGGSAADQRPPHPPVPWHGRHRGRRRAPLRGGSAGGPTTEKAKDVTNVEPLAVGPARVETPPPL